jgi:hypothetical protein
VYVPRPEPASPTTGFIHPSDDGFVPARTADQINGALKQHPPEVSVFTMMEQFRARARLDICARTVQLRELRVGQAVEDAQGAQIGRRHQLSPRYR